MLAEIDDWLHTLNARVTITNCPSSLGILPMGQLKVSVYAILYRAKLLIPSELGQFRKIKSNQAFAQTGGCPQ